MVGFWRNLVSPAKSRCIVRWNHDESLVRQWLKQEYPKIGALAQREKADIFFGDASHMRSDYHAGRTWGKKGETRLF